MARRTSHQVMRGPRGRCAGRGRRRLSSRSRGARIPAWRVRSAVTRAPPARTSREDCPCARPSTRRSDRRRAPPPIPGGARVPRSERRFGSDTQSSADRRPANAIPGQPLGWCPRPPCLDSSVRCSDGASSHSAGWPARGSTASLQTEGEQSPDVPWIRQRGKGVKSGAPGPPKSYPWPPPATT